MAQFAWGQMPVAGGRVQMQAGARWCSRGEGSGGNMCVCGRVSSKRLHSRNSVRRSPVAVADAVSVAAVSARSIALTLNPRLVATGAAPKLQRSLTFPLASVLPAFDAPPEGLKLQAMVLDGLPASATLTPSTGAPPCV